MQRPCFRPLLSALAKKLVMPLLLGTHAISEKKPVLPRFCDGTIVHLGIGEKSEQPKLQESESDSATGARRCVSRNSTGAGRKIIVGGENTMPPITQSPLLQCVYNVTLA